MICKEMVKKFIDILESLDHIPISVSDFKKLVGTTEFVIFHQLNRYSSLEELFTKHGSVIPMIILQTDKFGHFVILIKKSDKQAIFYDSYGMNLDELLKIQTKTWKESRGVNFLKELEKNSNMTIDYNRFKHQEQTKGDFEAVCAYHSSMRSRFPKLSNDQYNDLLKSIKIKPDYLCIMFHLSQILKS